MTGVRSPFSLVVAGDDLTFASSRLGTVPDDVHRVPRLGLNSLGNVIHTEVSAGKIRNVVVDGGAVFVFTNRNISNFDTDVVIEVGNPTPISSRTVTVPVAAPMVAARDGVVAWSQSSASDEIALRGASVPGIDASDGPTCLILTDQRLLWVDKDSPFEVGAVDRSALTGTPARLRSLDGLCVSVDSVGTAAAFASAGKILVEDGASSFEIVDPQPLEVAGAVAAVAIDASFVWWIVDDSPGTRHALIRARRAPPHLPQVVASIAQPCGLAVDDTHVYWSECGLAVDVIRRIRKPAP